jgi:hypothetical protein
MDGLKLAQELAIWFHLSFGKMGIHKQALFQQQNLYEQKSSRSKRN